MTANIFINQTLRQRKENNNQSQLNLTTLLSSFHFEGNGFVNQSSGSAIGCSFDASAKHCLIKSFCSAPIASGCADINKGALLCASNCIHCLFFSHGMAVVNPTQSPSTS